MLNISTQTTYLRELEKSNSTEDQELFSKDSEYLTGLQLKKHMDGNLINIPDKPGIMHSMI